MCRVPKGFTLVELSVTVAVVGVLASVALPSLAALLDHQRTSATLSSLAGHFQAARLEAIRHRTPVILCPTRDGAACAAGGDWSSGWLMFVDRGDLIPQAEDVLRMDLAPRTRELQIRGTAGRSLVRYLPDGRSAGSNATIAVCDRSGRRLGAVVINNAGRPRIERNATDLGCTT